MTNITEAPEPNEPLEQIVDQVRKLAESKFPDLDDAGMKNLAALSIVSTVLGDIIFDLSDGNGERMFSYHAATFQAGIELIGFQLGAIHVGTPSGETLQ